MHANAETGRGNSLTIRSIGPRDSDQVALLVRQLGYERSIDDVRTWIGALGLATDSQAAFVACVGGEVAGWVEVSLQRRLQTPAFALIGGLVVKDGARGMGIGARLCEQAEIWSRDRGVTMVRVTSRSTRTEAHGFYLREGYPQVKTSLVFEKQLQPIKE